MKRRSWIVGAVLAVLPSVLSPATTSASVVSTSLSGVVQSPAGAGIAGASVDVLERDTQSMLASADTAADGTYSMELESGDYDVRVRMPGGDVRARQTTPDVHVSGTKVVRFVMFPTATTVRMRGVVRDAEGHGVPGAELWFRQGLGGNLVTAAPASISDTRPPGTYDAVVPAGHYDFQLRGPSTGPAARMSVDFPLDLTADLITDLAIPTQEVAVAVTDASSAPVPGSSVRVEFGASIAVRVTPTIVGTGTFYGSSIAGSDGVARFNSFVTDTDVPIVAGPPTAATYAPSNGILPGGSTTASVQLAPTYDITGTVVDEQGSPLAGSAVTLQAPPSPSSFGSPFFTVLADSNGAFTMHAVRGAYRVVAYRSTYTPSPSSSRATYFGADVDLDGPASLTLPLRALTPINVRVVDADGGAVSSASVGARTAAGAGGMAPPAGASAFSNATTAADGTATLYALSDAPTRFDARPPVGYATDLTIDAPNSPVELRLPREVPVEGTARFDGAPLSNVNIRVGSPSGQRSTTTDGAGHYTTTAPPGPSRISVEQFGKPALPNFWVEGPVTIGDAGRSIDLDVPAARLEVRGAGVPNYSANINMYAMSPPGLGFAFADGTATGNWSRYVGNGVDGPIRTTVLPSPGATVYAENQQLRYPIADGDTVVYMRPRPDELAPTITASVTPTANTAGWSTSNVTVSFNCIDDQDPAPTCPSPVNVTAETAGQVVKGVTWDRAGNRATGSVLVKVDKTAPGIGAGSITPSAPTWTNADAVVTFTCSDSLSGVADCPAAQTVSGEGFGVTAIGTARDAAGLESTATATFNIDRTPPTVTASGFDPTGWTNQTTTVTFACTDSLSGMATCPGPRSFASEGQFPFAGTGYDLAGNSATATGTVRIDQTPPTATAVYPTGANGGWYRTAPTIALDCTDAASGIATCPSTTYAQDGANQTRTLRATDRAGNVTDIMVAASVDTVAPQTAMTSRLLATGRTLTVDGTATDTLSGVARVVVRYTGRTGTSVVEARVTCNANDCTWSAPPPSAPGRYTVAAIAYDVAGNADPTPASSTLVAA